MERDGVWYVDVKQVADDNYRRRHEYAFRWPEHWKTKAKYLMEVEGMTFEEAFDHIERAEDILRELAALGQQEKANK